MSTLLTLGNRKLGPTIWHFDLPAGPSCPGKSKFCFAVCYAKKGHYVFPNVAGKYAANLELWRQNPAKLERLLSAELDVLAAGTVIRLHTSGDFVSAGYVTLWSRLAATHPDLTFYGYTRSWRIASILPALDILRSLPNVTLWASTDPTMPAPPSDWPVTKIVPTFADAPGIAHCPEQTGQRKNCADCGLCWNVNLRTSAKLAFKLH
jgi:hypothetical protein